VTKFDYGMKNLNPVDHVRFYTKADPSVAVQVRKNQVSHFSLKTTLPQALDYKQ